MNNLLKVQNKKLIASADKPKVSDVPFTGKIIKAY
jgi:hypothetical protein